MAAAQHCADHDKTYCMNLSAPFIMQVPPFKKTLMDALPYVDYLFGNENEAAAFAESEGWPAGDIADIALRVRTLRCATLRYACLPACPHVAEIVGSMQPAEACKKGIRQYASSTHLHPPSLPQCCNTRGTRNSCNIRTP